NLYRYVRNHSTDCADSLGLQLQTEHDLWAREYIREDIAARNDTHVTNGPHMLMEVSFILGGPVVAPPLAVDVLMIPFKADVPYHMYNIGNARSGPDVTRAAGINLAIDWVTENCRVVVDSGPIPGTSGRTPEGDLVWAWAGRGLILYRWIKKPEPLRP